MYGNSIGLVFTPNRVAWRPCCVSQLLYVFSLYLSKWTLSTVDEHFRFSKRGIRDWKTIHLPAVSFAMDYSPNYYNRFAGIVIFFILVNCKRFSTIGNWTADRAYWELPKTVVLSLSSLSLKFIPKFNISFYRRILLMGFRIVFFFCKYNQGSPLILCEL